MKITPLSELEQYETDQLIMAVRGTVRHVGGIKTGETKIRGKDPIPWTLQIVKIADNGTEARLFFWDRPDLSRDLRQGSIVELQSTKNSKNKWGGLVTEFKKGSGNYPDDMVVKVSLGARMTVDGKDFAGEAQGQGADDGPPEPKRREQANRTPSEAPARGAAPSGNEPSNEPPPPTDPTPQPPAPQRPAKKKLTKEEKAKVDKQATVEASKAVARLGNAYKICLYRARAVADWDHAHSAACPKWDVDEVKDLATTLFIEGNKKGFFVFLPDDVDVSTLLPSLGAEPVAKPAAAGQTPQP